MERERERQVQEPSPGGSSQGGDGAMSRTRLGSSRRSGC